MKKFQDLKNNSSIICSFLSSDKPNPNYKKILEGIKDLQESLNIP